MMFRANHLVPMLLRAASSCLLLAAAITGGGCAFTSAERPGAATPEMQLPSLAGTPPVYGSWTDQTEGKIGEDLYPCLHSGARAIVFSSSRHSQDYKLYMRHFGDRSVRRLTSGPGDDIDPAISPDGACAVFPSNRTGIWRLYLMDGFDGAPARAIGDEAIEAAHPAWSPDGKTLAYNRRSPVTGGWEIWILELESGMERFLCAGVNPEYSPSGERVAFQRHRERDGELYSIWTVELDGTREREVVVGREWAAVNPAWSPRGDWIVFNTIPMQVSAADARESATPRPRASGGDLYRVRPDGSGLTRLTFTPGAEWNPHWGEDGSIYFNADVDGRTAIWSIAAPE